MASPRLRACRGEECSDGRIRVSRTRTKRQRPFALQSTTTHVKDGHTQFDLLHPTQPSDVLDDHQSQIPPSLGFILGNDRGIHIEAEQGDHDPHSEEIEYVHPFSDLEAVSLE